MKDNQIDKELEKLLISWKVGLIDSEFVSSSSLDTLKNRIMNFIHTNIHIDDEELNDFAHSLEHYVGG